MTRPDSCLTLKLQIGHLIIDSTKSAYVTSIFLAKVCIHLQKILYGFDLKEENT